MCNFKEGIEMNRQNTYEAMSCGGNETCFLNINKHGQVRQVNNFSRASKIGLTDDKDLFAVSIVAKDKNIKKKFITQNTTSR